MTFQTFFLLVGASTLRGTYSLQMIGWYLLLGLLGLPFFSGNGAGVQYLLGPTGGYLVGFVVTTWILGQFRAGGALGQFLLFLLAHSLLFVPGVIWLKIVTGSPWSKSLEMGLYPFLLGDLIKSSMAFCLWFLIPDRLRFRN
jgi:biotin transport system substrate-specific component